MTEHRYTLTFVASSKGAGQVHDLINSLRMVSGVSPACVVLPREDQEPLVNSLAWLLGAQRQHMKYLAASIASIPRHHIACGDGGMYDNPDPRGEYVKWEDVIKLIDIDPERVLAGAPIRDADGSPLHSDQWWVNALENAGNHFGFRCERATLLRACAVAVKLARLVLTPTPQPQPPRER